MQSTFARKSEPAQLLRGIIGQIKLTILEELDIMMRYMRNFKNRAYEILLNSKDYDGQVTSSIWMITHTENDSGKEQCWK